MTQLKEQSIEAYNSKNQAHKKQHSLPSLAILIPPSSSTEEATGCLKFFLVEREAEEEEEKGKQKAKRLKTFMW